MLIFAQFPDYYTNKKFVTFYWKSFVAETGSAFNTAEVNTDKVMVTLHRRKGTIVGVSPVKDYIHRPLELKNLTLYNWICPCQWVANSSYGKKTHKDKPLPSDNDDTLDTGNVYDDVVPCSHTDDVESLSDIIPSTPSDISSIRDFMVDNKHNESNDERASVIKDMIATAAARVP